MENSIAPFIIQLGRSAPWVPKEKPSLWRLLEIWFLNWSAQKLPILLPKTNAIVSRLAGKKVIRTTVSKFIYYIKNSQFRSEYGTLCVKSRRKYDGGSSFCCRNRKHIFVRGSIHLLSSETTIINIRHMQAFSSRNIRFNVLPSSPNHQSPIGVILLTNCNIGKGKPCWLNLLTASLTDIICWC